MSEHVAHSAAQPVPTRAELAYLRRGIREPGGKLPLFDRRGQEISPAIIQICIANGWAEHWFANPVKPDWLVCRLTQAGRDLVQRHWPAARAEG
ncbi:MAG: hypothetical protein Q7N95_06710 [Alphaproteobacteria bacterium]|nr:hypothetical protein [Alphaproteobacteria bacterium]